MPIVQTAADTACEAVRKEKASIRTPMADMVRKFRKQRNSVVALAFIIILVMIAFFGDFLIPY